MKDYVKKMGLLGLGAAIVTKEKAEEMAGDLIKKGELSEKEGKKLVTDIMKSSKKQSGELQKMIDTEVRKTAAKLNLATKDDLKNLEKKLVGMNKGAAPAKKTVKTTVKKAAPKKKAPAKKTNAKAKK